jgi:hypothetical protein
MGNPAVAEAIRNLAGWTVSLWLTAEPVYGHSGGHGSGNAKMQPGTSGPMRGTVELLEGSPEVFAFHRYGRPAVRVRFDQVAYWHELAPPPRPPLPVQEQERPA